MVCQPVAVLRVVSARYRTSGSLRGEACSKSEVGSILAFEPTMALHRGAAGNPIPRRREVPLRRLVSRLLRIARGEPD